MGPNPITPSTKQKPRPHPHSSSSPSFLDQPLQNPAAAAIKIFFFLLQTLTLLQEMAKDTMPRPWFLDLVPLMVVLLAVAHVLALVTN
jgi:tellurite resistance protein TehA-like permease